ncbi:MAG: hypothetical protein ABJB49_02350 [Nitrospirota bacterium]
MAERKFPYTIDKLKAMILQGIWATTRSRTIQIQKPPIMKFTIKPIILGLILVVSNTAKSQNCSEGSASSAKHHKIYLYFPTSDDATFPELGNFSGLPTTTPLKKFAVADLDAAIGTTDALINAILGIVADDYCEFDVQVVSTKTKPVPPEAQWNVVGVGSDTDPTGNGTFGLAHSVGTNIDLNNLVPQDFARVWGGTYKTLFGAGGSLPPLVLSGASSTLARWANAIGGTASHEAGHNFGLQHSTALRPGEDPMPNHLMPAGSNIDGTHRAGSRHFSDESYEILGHNIGLNTFTLTNWDFINPNTQEAHSCVLTILTHAASLSFSRVYDGSLTPWANPTITASGTSTFQGDTFNKFLLTFSVPKAWGGGVDGIVAGGAPFHVGASFNEPDLIIVSEVRVRDAGGTNLGLHPRVPSFDAGSADMASGDFMFQMINGDAGNGALQIANLQVFYLPRMAAIQNMVNGDTLRDNQGFVINMKNASRNFSFERNTVLKDTAMFRIAKYTDPRTVDITYDNRNCKRGFVPLAKGNGDAMFGDIEYCAHGIALSLFPSTYVYMIVTVVDPNATYFDKAQNKMVTGPLTSKVFYQFAGKVPDFNKNGIDDLVDIRTKTSVDTNNNGIPDDGEKVNPGPSHPTEGWPPWIWILLIGIVLLIAIFIIAKRRKPV